MPIRPQHRWLYPIDWPQLSAMIRFERAGGRCEHCARPHGAIVCHLGDGRWWDETDQVWRSANGNAMRRLGRKAPSLTGSGVRTTKVFLATAHLDHDPTNNRQRNLKALCQRCHMVYDCAEHSRRRWLTRHMRKAIGDLFSGIYST